MKNTAAKKTDGHTIIIFVDGDIDIKFFVVPGDYSHLQLAYINSVNTSAKHEKELYTLLYIKKPNVGGPYFSHNVHTTFPTDFLRQNPDSKVIVAGCLP